MPYPAVYLVEYSFFWFHKYLNSKFLKGKNEPPTCVTVLLSALHQELNNFLCIFGS